MPAGTPDDQYLTWLYGQVAEVRARKSSKTYWDLLRQLYSTLFVWEVPNDDNREADGKELRTEWIRETGVSVDPEWLSLGCSFLEMLIGLSKRLEFETDQDAAWWFWHLIDNVGLLGCHDRSNFSPEMVENCTFTVIFRTYAPDGKGGLFPLRRPSRDQRKVELWYQLCEYLLQDA